MFVMGTEEKLETTAYSASSEGFVTIDLRLLESLADFDDPSDSDYKLFSQVHILATKVQARNAELRVKRIEKLEKEYELFVLECRATKDKYDAFSLDPLWQEEGRKLENEVAAYRNRLQEVIAYNRPLPSSFPTQKEIAVYEKKKAAAETALQKKRDEVSNYQADDAIRTAEINRNKLHLAELVAKEKVLRTQLNKLKGVQEAPDGRRFGLSSSL